MGGRTACEGVHQDVLIGCASESVVFPFLLTGFDHPIVLGLIDPLGVKGFTDGLLIAVDGGVRRRGRRDAAFSENVVPFDQLGHGPFVVVGHGGIVLTAQFPPRLLAVAVIYVPRIQTIDLRQFPCPLPHHVAIGLANTGAVVENFSGGMRRLVGKLHTA